MNKILLPFLSLSLLTASCGLQNPSNSSGDAQFTIIGKWGMVSGTITDGDGKTNRYGKLSDGSYYQTLEYLVDGSYIKTTFPDNKVSYGTYTYNNSNQSMQYKLDGDKYFVPARITIHSANEMTIFTDWGSVGSMTQYMTKIK